MISGEVVKSLKREWENCPPVEKKIRLNLLSLCEKLDPKLKLEDWMKQMQDSWLDKLAKDVQFQRLEDIERGRILIATIDQIRVRFKYGSVN